MLKINEIIEILIDDYDDQDINDVVEAPRQPRVFRDWPNHMDIWNDKEFIEKFRLSKESVLEVLKQVEPLLIRPTNQNHDLTPQLQILITLRFYAMGSMLIVAGDFGGIHVSTASKVIYHTTRAIASLSRRYIKMPAPEEIQQSKLLFSEIARFPKVIGAIDCTHVRLQSPGGDNAENFRNRKGYFSLNVQTISDGNLKIINIVARWPGASYDSTIFNNSRIKAAFEQGTYKDCFLLGDSGYALSEYLLTPLQNPRIAAEILYNESQIRTRNVVERQYGVWKRRFPILSLGIRLKLETAQAITVATAVLHNIAIEGNDNLPDGPEEKDEDNREFDILVPQGNESMVR